MTGSRAGPNPYVGPRPFETGEPLFGRDRELRELLYLLSGERIVLLHSPSGAGKSSLIQAGLIPRLRERFDVWRPTRVGHPPPPEVAPEANRYALSAMLGFEQGIPESLRRPAAALAGLRLGEYAATRPRRPGAPEHLALIFDQFEEVLTADPLALAAKRAFFTELGELLQDPRVWALFSLREDYLAPLDPYAEQVPTHLRSRYRLDMLGTGAAREAIARPADGDARQWTEPALSRVVRDLAAVKVQQADGSFAERTGLYIEPMQLQVVCRGLWERMPADDVSVDLEDVEAFGDVTHALATYYAEEVRRIAGQEEAAERALREWVGEKLITSDGIRRPVLRTAGASEGLANELIARLVDAHLVRADHRGGATWYELAHDRLVAPLRADNERWAQTHLQPMQIQAALWARQGKPAALLLSEEALAEAERWAAGRTLAEPDLGFLAASRAARAQERALREAQAQALKAAQELAAAQARAAARQRRFTQVVGLLLLLSLVAAGFSLWQYREAGRQAERAEAKTKEALRETLRAEEESRQAEWQAERAGTLLKMSGVRELVEREEQGQAAQLLLEVRDAPAWVDLAHEILKELPELTLRGHLKDVGPVAWSPDGRRIASGSEDGTARVWMADGTGVPRVLQHDGPLKDLDFSPDGSRVITLDERRRTQVRLWTLAEPTSSRLLAEDRDKLEWTWSPDGRRIVVIGFEDGSARVVPTEGPGESVPLGGPFMRVLGSGNGIRAAAWSPDGAHVLLVDSFGLASVWTPEGVSEASVSTEIQEPEAAGWSPDGRRVVIARDDSPERRWSKQGSVEVDVEAKVGMWELRRASGSWNLREVESTVGGEFNFWRVMDTSGQILMPFTGGTTVWSPQGVLLFVLEGRYGNQSPDGAREIDGARDGTVRVMPTQKAEPLQLEGASDGAWSPDGKRMLAWSDDKAWVWRPGEEGEPVALKGAAEGASGWAWSPDGARVLAASYAGVQIWASDGAKEPLSRGISPELRSGCLRAAGRHAAEDEEELADAPPEYRARVRERQRRDDILWTVWSPDSARVAFVSQKMGRCVILWAAEGTAEPVILKSAEDLVPAMSRPSFWERRRERTLEVEAVAWSSDGTRILTSSETTTRVWSSDGRGEPLVVPGHSAAWSPDGRRLVVTQADGSVRVWVAEGTGEPVTVADEAPIESTQWSPDGRHILVRSQASGAEPVLRLWTLAGAGRLVPQGEGARAVWSPEGGRLFLWYGDRRAPRVWSVDGAAEPLVLAGNKGAITAATWSADGRLVVTSEGSSDIQVWAADGAAPPINIPDLGTPELSRDGARLRVDASVWRLTVPELREVLRRANRDCLSPANRVAYLGEMSHDALARYEACEREYGREPFFTSTVSDEGRASDDPRGGPRRGRSRGGDAESDPSEE